MYYVIDFGMGNRGAYGKFWLGTVPYWVVGMIAFILAFTGPLGCAWATRENYRRQNPVLMALNFLALLAWLVIWYCIIGGQLGVF